jgi:hypothetical protein
MFCVFHPTNAATSQCAGCNRALCPNCDHRIKGYPHCEECIVRGVAALKRPAEWRGDPPAPLAVVRPAQKSRAKLATLCAFVPGLGAVYNRQNLKALVHFLGVVGLAQIADVTNVELFGVGSAIFYLYTIIDANRTAKAIAAGIDPREDEARMKWTFARHRAAWGAGLCAVALVVALSSLATLPIGLSPSRVWALVLFASGAYLIASYFRGSSRGAPPTAIPPVPRSVVSTALPPISESGVGQHSADSRSRGR